MNRKTIRTASLAVIAIAGSLPLTAQAQSRALQPGEAWLVGKTTRLTSLSIANGASIVAGTDKVVTMTVDGHSVPIAPGDYRGSIVLSLANSVAWKSFFGDKDYKVPTALYVNDGKVDAARTVAGAGTGTIGTDKASNLRITSNDTGFTGVIVEGKSTYALDNPVIILGGNGVDDSIGFGAGIAVKGDAHVTIEHPVIRTRGVVRTAIFVDGRAVVDINNADIETRDGVLPAGYAFSIEPGKMMEVPYGLGIAGNVRATNVQGTAKVTYRHSRIRAEAWGALATDGAGPTALTVIDSVIETVRSGYGAYANGEAQDLFDNTVFRVTDYGLIVGGPGSATFTNGSFVSSGKYGVMMHQGTGGGVVRFEKGSALVTNRTGFVVKGRGTTIEIDHARVLPGNGVLVQTMENDDPIMVAMMAAGPPPGAPQGPPPGAADPSQGGGMPGAGAKAYDGKVVVKIKGTTLFGDVLHAMRGKGGMDVTVTDGSLEGAISLAVARPASGNAPTRETFDTVSDVVDTLGPDGKEPLSVSLDGGSRWAVTRTSWLSSLQLAPDARLEAAAGRKLRLFVNGKETSPVPGRYAGAIELRVQDN
jgi:hypothetical protein